jgi:hypothetical protein
MRAYLYKRNLAMNVTKRVILATVVLALAGCGGGGGDSPTPSTTAAEGLYTGTTGTGRALTGLVLDDGTYYILYSPVGNPSLIAGVVQGNGASSASTFTSSNTRDFNLEGFGVLSGTVSASYTVKQSISGTVAYSGGGGSTTFSGTYDSLYEATPSLAALAGTFTGQVASSAGGENATVTVLSTGTFSGLSSGGCSFTGTVAPRATGNVFNMSINFGGAPCIFANQTLSGIAFFNASAKRLYAATPNAARTDGALFVGTKP